MCICFAQTLSCVVIINCVLGKRVFRSLHNSFRWLWSTDITTSSRTAKLKRLPSKRLMRARYRQTPMPSWCPLAVIGTRRVHSLVIEINFQTQSSIRGFKLRIEFALIVCVDCAIESSEFVLYCGIQFTQICFCHITVCAVDYLCRIDRSCILYGFTLRIPSCLQSILSNCKESLCTYGSALVRLILNGFL